MVPSSDLLIEGVFIPPASKMSFTENLSASTLQYNYFPKLILLSTLQYNYAVLCAKLLQSCPTLCNPMDCSPLGSSVYGILQARMVERVDAPSFRGSFNPGVEPRSDSLPSEPPGKPMLILGEIMVMLLRRRMSFFRDACRCNKK